MKTNNPVLDTLVESQTQFINNWMDSARKMQSAFVSGNIAHDGQSLYKEYFDKQMDLFRTMQDRANAQNTDNNPQEFFQKWFNQQAQYAKQFGDFAQSVQSSFANFGRPANDYMSNFGQANTAFTNIYNAWLSAINASYETMSRQMSSTFNKDVFGNFMQGNQLYIKMQEMFQPMVEAFKKGQFDVESIKNFYKPEQYQQLAKQMFGNMFDNASMKEAFDGNMKKLQEFFAGQNNLGKEYAAQMQNIASNFPSLFNPSHNMKEFYDQAGSMFTKSFEPLMKLVNGGKEKESAEAVIQMMDKLAAYSVKQAELQMFLQNTARAAFENIGTQFAEKMSKGNMAEVPTSQEMYNEWVKVNEKMFSDLFASDEFSKVKGEALDLSMEVKMLFEKQFENTMSNLPFVFKSETNELIKAIHELRKQVKDLQSKMTLQGNGEASHEDGHKARKK